MMNYTERLRLLAPRATLKVLQRLEGINEDLSQLAARMAGYGVCLLGVGVALSFPGATIQPLLTAAIIVAVIAGLALRGVADNFAAGVVIQTRQPIQLPRQPSSARPRCRGASLSSCVCGTIRTRPTITCSGTGGLGRRAAL